MKPGRTRVAILGGGCGGVAAAWALSRTAALRERVEVTLYEASARLGGKGATARDPGRGQRIEEHGLHVWLGWYERSFAMMRDVLDGYRDPDGSPFGLRDAFHPHHKVSLVAAGRADEVWHLSLPPRPGLPWEPTQLRDLTAYPVELGRWVTQDAWRDVLTQAPAHVLARQTRVLAALSQVILRGLVRDVVPLGVERGMARLDEEDLRAWLVRHGATSDEVSDAPPVRAIYDLAFAYPEGVSGRGRGSVAAGAALRTLLKLLFSYRGAPFWKMTRGMGDTVFAPLHAVLRERGVRLALHHRVGALSLDQSRTRIETISLDAREPPGEPLAVVRGMRVWPHEPDRPAAAARTLSLRRGQDFDAVVLAIPAPALAPLTRDLAAAHPPFAAMLAATNSVATWAMQLWLTPPMAELGFAGGPTVMTSFAHPFGSWADMSEVLAAEAWPQGASPRSLAYFCDVARGGSVDEVRAAARAFVRAELPRLWPRFDEAMLVGGLEEQYFRANVEPSERYVLSLPGSTRHRLRPDGSGFQNLFLAGDWTRTRINGGSVEAAVESGVVAAESLLARLT